MTAISLETTAGQDSAWRSTVELDDGRRLRVLRPPMNTLGLLIDGLAQDRTVTLLVDEPDGPPRSVELDPRRVVKVS